MARIRPPSPAVMAARGRRGRLAAGRGARIEWYIRNVSDKVSMTMKARVTLATQLVKTKVVHNISRPVTRGTGPRGGKVVTDRSKPGEFPKAETTRLLKDVFSEVRRSSKGIYDGVIGTTLDYGLILETRMNRSFLKRTLDEERPTVMRLLTGPIK